MRDSWEVTAEKWVYGGDALARAPAADAEAPASEGPGKPGRVMLIPFVLPGETVRARLVDDLYAKAERIAVASPARVTPPCPLFTRCGGCHYQHAPYEYQLARKVEILREQLQRVGKIRFEGEIGVVSGPPLGYRNRVQLHVEGGRIGYRAAGSHALVPLEGECPIASPRLQKAFELLRSRMREPRFPRFVHSLELFTNESEVQVNVLESERQVAQWFYEWCESAAVIEYPAINTQFRVSPRSFFQVNRFLMDALIEEALGTASGASALDLYSGVGLFALGLARQFAKVTAVEAGASAVRDLEFNAHRAGVSVKVHQARVEDHMARLDRAPDFVLADPPRAGLGKAVTGHLERLAPPRIVVVSCDPSTLARDLATLKNYRIERLTLVDLFPQTYHLETIAHLVRIG
ncbi:MAG TPA: class I SAM-dependent RNA methyltransferase [Bryobacteraceae bacterium]|nr:class I SAM-dependent RNA methyltransferase [Bryobacteraceae bacterium]